MLYLLDLELFLGCWDSVFASTQAFAPFTAVKLAVVAMPFTLVGTSCSLFDRFIRFRIDGTTDDISLTKAMEVL